MHSAEKLLDKMRKKGWSEQDLVHADLIFSQHEETHHIVNSIYDKILHWIVFLTMIIGNFMVFFFLLPFIMIITGNFIYLLVALVAVLIGAVFETVINGMTALKGHHQFILAVVIPLISLGVFMYELLYAEGVFKYNTYKVTPICITYALFFILPYYIRKIRGFFTK